MRSFPLLMLILFLLLYFLISTGAILAFRRILRESKQKWLTAAVSGFGILLVAIFVFLYIYPNQPSRATNYLVYFYFNAILFIDFICKSILSVFLLIHLLSRRWIHKPVLIYSGIILTAGVGLTLLYGIFIGHQQLQMKELTLKYENLPSEFDNYKILHFSDTHLGGMSDYLGKVSRLNSIVNNSEPDLLLFTGDMVNNFAGENSDWIDNFRQLTEQVPAYSILGNHDYGDYSRWDNPEKKEENFQKIIQAQRDMGFRLLLNEHVHITKGSDSIFLAGVENWGHPPFPQYADLETAIEGIPNDAFVILMTHDPAHWESKVKFMNSIELSLSGHTHGMQWGIYLAGIPFSLAYLTRENWGGLYTYGNSALVVNTGFGTIGVPWRIDMPADVTLITLKRIESD